ncbi:methyl-accepting chemotaxis protein, partial [Campylobacter sp. B0100352/1]|uniref:cache domain-containing protein n=1 Tax=Campylobacter sp. B0100352/1 TaxID=2735783 RepID=UPI001D3A1887|nr:methyl-accepting chemotaxis protein [Campylobacter sp. B0100352/1]
MSIKIKMSLIANIIAIICLLALGIVTFIFVKDALLKQVISTQTNYVKTAKSSMTNYNEVKLTVLKELANSLSKLPLSSFSDEKAVLDNAGLIFQNYRKGGDLLAAYIGLSNGEYIGSDPRSDKKNVDAIIYGKANNYDSRNRDWYKNAKEQNGIYESPSYIDTASNLPCFTYSMPFYKDGKFIGVLAIDVSNANLQKQFDKLSGDVFVFDQKNYVFVSSNKAFLGQNSNIPNIESKFKQTGDYNSFSYTRIQGGDRLAMCSQFNNYTICSSEPVEAIQKQVSKIAYIQIIIVVVIIIISIVLL